MKPSKTFLESISDLEEVKTAGDVRRVVANALLALARKEISATDVTAMAGALDSISNSLNTELKAAKAQVEMREAGVEMGKIASMGQMLIGASTPSK